MTDKAFESALSPKAVLHEVLKVPQDAVAYSSNWSKKVSTLRGLFRSYSWVLQQDVHVIELLMQGKVTCRWCYGAGLSSGIMFAKENLLERHQESDAHSRQAKAAQKQLTLMEAGGVVHREAEEIRERRHLLVMGGLLAGGNGSAGLPPTACSSLLDADMLLLLRRVDAVSSPRTIFRDDLPAIVSMLKAYIKNMIGDKQIALGIDGGHSNLADGVKLLAILAISPELSCDVLLDLRLLPFHETASIQARALEDIRSAYSVDKSAIKYVVADNASVNNATVKELAKDYGWNAGYARCLPHSLNLVLVAFLEPFEKRFQMASHLKGVRGFIKSGGGSSRRATMLEYGITLSRVDFADTRWASFISAVKYMVDMQDAGELQKARERLETLAAHGDEDAAAALKEPDTPQLHWYALYDCLEELALKCKHAGRDAGADPEATFAAAGGDVAARSSVDGLLSYNTDVINYAAFVAVNKILGGAPKLFALAQGGAQWSAKLRDDSGAIADAGTGCAQLLASVKGLKLSANLSRVLDEVRRQCVDFIEEGLTRSKRYDEGIVPEQDHYREEDVPKYRAAAAANIETAIKAVEKAVQSGVKAVDKCEGTAKLQEAIDELNARKFYLTHSVPASALDDDAAFLQQIYAPQDTPYEKISPLRTEYEAYQLGYRRAADPVTPSAAYTYWKSMREEWPNLSALAMRLIMRPVSSAAVERIFSYLTKMDAKDRQSMKEATLYNLLFIRSNWRLLKEMIAQHAVADRARHSAAEEATREAIALGKRRRDDGRASDAMDTLRRVRPHAASVEQLGEGEDSRSNVDMLLELE